MENIIYKLNEDSLDLSLTTKNKGKFRWKNRFDNSQYGKGFATTSIPFNENSYIEWQIGYDSEINHAKKTTILNNLEFIGSNGKTKNPYELSEILYLTKKIGLIDNGMLEDIYQSIEAGNFSFEETYQIETDIKDTVTLADFTFHRQDIILPTFSDYAEDRGLSIEISIQKQMYASGVQPMVYLTIPIKNFDNYNEMIGKNSDEIHEAILNINKDNLSVIVKLFQYFGICSWKHKHDVLSIIRAIINFND